MRVAQPPGEPGPHRHQEYIGLGHVAKGNLERVGERTRDRAGPRSARGRAGGAAPAGTTATPRRPALGIGQDVDREHALEPGRGARWPNPVAGGEGISDPYCQIRPCIASALMVDSVYHMAAFTLTQAAQILKVPQHKLIHLCEKKVVVPDVQDARGRGSSRQFSRRNLFDLAVALEMRRLELPVSFVQAVLRVLRAFETEVRSLQADFVLPDSLLAAQAPRLTLLILDGERLYFTLTQGKEPPRLFGGVDVRHPRARGRARKHQGVGRLQQAETQGALEGARTRTEVDLSQIARDLQGRLPRS